MPHLSQITVFIFCKTISMLLLDF